ncbi:MAG: DUF1996 domain-containing protein [Ilumatobacter sp.]|uniref:DUF1996 domain-containing protein n=1 Tax=Ilumatobacter sp. TaxID=1967498 RepID=UPI003919F506
MTPSRPRKAESIGRLRAIVAASTIVLAIVSAACGGGEPGSDAGGEIDPQRIGPQGRVPQFVVECEVSHLAFDDPIVLPWQPGASHQHQFFGNNAVDSDPGYERAIGATTSCDQRLDTASYWSPTLLDDRGARIDALGLTAYYRPGNGVDHADVVAYPAGFMMIAGDAAAAETPDLDVVAWGCGGGARREVEPPACSSNSTLRLWITFPDCWDGSRLSSFGSGAHVRYSDGGCPDSHPIAVPQLLMAIDFPPVDPTGLSLSSGSLETAHADFWNTWDQDKLESEVTNCLNRGLVCGLGS